MDGHRCFYPVHRGALADRELSIMRSLFELLEWAGYILFTIVAIGIVIIGVLELIAIIGWLG
jgi:hypothetical protein